MRRLQKRISIKAWEFVQLLYEAVGFASTNIDTRMEDAARTAVSSARIRGTDPAWKSFHTDGKYLK
jgi:hypothetical protein